MKVLYIGNYNWDHYLRGRVLYRGLLDNNVDVELFLKKKDYLSIIRRILKKDYDIILASGKPTVMIANLFRVFHRRKVIFDVFISDYENLVLNKKTVQKGSLKALFLKLFDKYSCKLSNLNLLDTKEHVEYFCKTYNLSKNKFKILPIGTDENIFYPRKEKPHKKFKVLFFGSFNIGHGIDTILKAAKLLEKYDIEIDLIGEGPLFKEMKKLSKSLNNKNIKFLGWVNQEDLPKKISNYDVCLGLFDDNVPKMKRVIPTKVFQLTAMKKAIITGKTKAVESYFTHEKNIILSNMGDEKDLAASIIKLYENPELLKKIAENGHKVFEENFKTVSIGKRLKNIIKNIINS